MNTALWKKYLPAALLLVLLWTCVRLAVLSHTGFPAPRYHDEFSYLLGADTLAHGRLANPPHPLAKFFESPHELFRPMYAPKYPPGQAMFLAIGQRLFGSPFYGVLIGNILMLFTISLALFVWVQARWAMAVSAMFALIMWPGMYWTNSYWGGSVAASGGALVLLGIGMYRKERPSVGAAIFALGALLLFWTRPYEGGVFTLAVLAVFAKELWQKRQAGAFAVALIILLPGVLWTGYYNKAITGSPFRLPYLEHEHQYSVTPLFWFLPLRSQPVYSHPRLAALHGTTGQEASWYRGNLHAWNKFGTRLVPIMRYTVMHLALLTLIVPLAWHEPLYRRMALVAGVFLVALALETFDFQHFTAPVWAALGVMIAIGAEKTWNWRFKRLSIGKVLVLFVLASPGISALAKEEVASHRSHLTPDETDWPARRVALIERLSSLKQRQLVIVQYPSPVWRVGEEWVYNGADIDQQRVVFAHDLGRDEDRALLRYFPDRTPWLLTFNAATGQEHIEPYPRPSTQ